MQSRLLLGVLLLLCLCLMPLTSAAQASSTAPAVVAASGVIPSLINYTGVLKDATGRTLTSLTGVTFLLYKEEQGGAPLWLETQNVQPDQAGRYTVQLGAATRNGIPPDLFTNGEARWLALQVGSEPELPRTLLVAVPYAMKSVDAQTRGGLPPSAFFLAAPPSSSSSAAAPAVASSINATAAVPPPAVGVTTSGSAGNVGTLALFSTATDIEKSIVTQTGAAINVLGKLNLPAQGTATAVKGFNSQPQTFLTSSFNGTSHVPVTQTFLWQAEPTGNNTAAPSGTLNLLFASGVAAPAETGFKLTSKGQLIFAAGQTFPGTGTVTSVTAGAGLAGGTITKTGTISIPNAGVTNTMLAHSSLSVLPGTDLTGGGPVSLGGSTTLNLDTTKVPQLSATNSFTGATNSFSGISATSVTSTTLSATGAVTGAQLTSGGTVNVDENGANTGTELPGLQFGAGASGEAISSARSSGATNEVGLDFYTGSVRVMSIAHFSQVAIGVPPPLDSNTQLAVSSNGSTQAFNAFSAVAASLPSGSFASGGVAGSFVGGAGDLIDGFSDGDGIDATNADGGTASGGAFAGNFTGDVNVSHQIFATVKDFKIDHPLDPANKYLLHSSVESSEMMNIYTGNAVLDAAGEARIELPDWFEALNGDFRYQLTAIGKPGPGLYIAEKISGNHFTIAGGSAGAEVSWQVTGVRQDPYVKAHPLVVEQEKEARLKGFYIHPELYGQPEEKQIEFARNPAWMRQVKELKAKRGPAKPVAQSPAKPSRPGITPVVAR